MRRVLEAVLQGPPHKTGEPVSDAPTTLPTTATTQTTGWQRIGCTLAAPAAGFRALAVDERARPVEAVGVYFVVVVAVAAADVFRLLALAGTAPGVAASRILDLLVRAARTDLAVVAGAAVVVAAIAWALASEVDRRRRAVGAAIATTYLLVPLAVMKAIGGLCAFVGFEFWFLPHRAVDSFAVVVGEGAGQHVDWLRFAVKCAVSFGPGLAVLLHWLVKGRQHTEIPVRPFIARAGFTVVVVVVTALVVAAVVTVAGRSEQLRPRLAGDAFPSLALRKLDGDNKRKGRVDIVELAGSAGTKAVVVDFWASWCGPCRRSIPELSALSEGWRDRGVVVIGVNREAGDIDAAKKAWAELKPSFRSLLDDRGLGERLGLTSLPSSYVLDAKGVIRHLHLGYTDPAQVKAEVEALLAE